MRKKREVSEVNAGSMADIAFLLLIFFLMVTTIDTDKGIPRRLPPMPEDDVKIDEVKLKQRNVFNIRVNSLDYLLVEGDYANIRNLRKLVKEFILNPAKKSNLAETPQRAIVSIKNDRGTSYDIYLQIQDELTAAYREIRDEASQKKYGMDFADLSEKKQKIIKDMYPMKVSEAEPENSGEK